MEVFIAVFSIIWGILSLVLFFKVWGMTNDVNEMLRIMQEQTKSQTDTKEETAPVEVSSSEETPIEKEEPRVKVGDTILHLKDGKHYEVAKVDAGSVLIDRGFFFGPVWLTPDQYELISPS